MFRMILNLAGNSPMTGLTLRATGLYFFFVARLTETGSGGLGSIIVWPKVDIVSGKLGLSVKQLIVWQVCCKFCPMTAVVAVVV